MPCAVWGCTNANPTTADPSIHYYVFPKHPIIAQQWVTACGWPPEDIDVTKAQICSIHFSEDSYTTEIKLIEYITCYTKVLKFDAVPTLFLPLTQQIVIKETTPQEDLREMIVFAAEPEIAEKYKHIETKEQLAALENTNQTLREKVETLENNLRRSKETLAKQMEVYKLKDVVLSDRHQEYLRTKRTFLSLQQQRALLSKVFSESQIKILSGKKKIYWSNDDMAVGYTIRHLSNKRCYMYLTKKLNIPLPAVSSIKRWMTLKNIDDKREATSGSPKKEEAETDS